MPATDIGERIATALERIATVLEAGAFPPLELQDEQLAPEPEVEITEAELRNLVKELVAKGQKDRVREILEEHGFTRLAQIPVEKYSTIREALRNA